MRFAGFLCFRSFNEIVLDCSLPAKGIYLKKGYSFIRAETIETDNGDRLCYDVMGKKVRKKLPENIFPMTAENYREVYRLWKNTKGMGLNDIDDSYEGIKRFLERNPCTCFVARENGRVIGTVICGSDGRRGYIYHTAVDENHRNRGVATALVDSAVNALIELGIAKTALVVFKKNELGNAFWEKKGFTVRDDLVYRNKTLTEMKRIDT